MDKKAYQPSLYRLFLWLLFLYNYVLVIGVTSEIYFIHGLPLDTYIVNFGIWAPAFLKLFLISVVACFIAALMVQYQFSCRISAEGLDAKNALGIPKHLKWEELAVIKARNIPLVPFVSVKQQGSGIPLWVCAEAGEVLHEKLRIQSERNVNVSPAHA